MPRLLIFGDTGVGKTKIIRKFARGHPPTFCQATGVTRRPVVVAQIPPELVERDLYRELLASLDAPALVGGTLAREKDVCRSLLRTVEARMIVLDEVNGMLAGGGRARRRAASTSGKDRNDPARWAGAKRASRGGSFDALGAARRPGRRAAGVGVVDRSKRMALSDRGSACHRRSLSARAAADCLSCGDPGRLSGVVWRRGGRRRRRREGPIGASRRVRAARERLRGASEGLPWERRERALGGITPLWRGKSSRIRIKLPRLRCRKSSAPASCRA
jgi:hypothetical protein